jgi:hypothetical protein
MNWKSMPMQAKVVARQAHHSCDPVYWAMEVYIDGHLIVLQMSVHDYAQLKADHIEPKHDVLVPIARMICAHDE